MALHWAETICEIQKKGSTLTKIAEQEEVSLSVVSEVIRGIKVSHRVAYAISALIGVPTEDIWPGKYLTCPAEYKRLRGDNKRGRLPSSSDTAMQEAS